MAAEEQDNMLVDDEKNPKHASTSLSNGYADRLSEKQNVLSTTNRTSARPLHRCRFIDWFPSTISALTITPSTFDAQYLNFGGCSEERGLLGVGRANGDVDLMLWGGQQGWTAWRIQCEEGHGDSAFLWTFENSTLISYLAFFQTLPSSFPLPQLKNSKKPSSMLSHLLFTHQTTLSSSDLDLFEGDVEGAEREIKRLKREGCRLFGLGGVGSELVEWEWGGPGSSSKHIGRVKSTLPTLPPIFALAASPSQAHLAIGCEDSTIRILNILDDELELISKIEVGGAGKVRALSLAWGPSIVTPPKPPTTSAELTAVMASKGKARDDSPKLPEESSSLPSSFATLSESFLIAGCSNSSIRRYNAPTSGLASGVWRATHHMTVDRLKGEHTVVWALAVLEKDGRTIVSGDSMGNVKFWDTKMGTQVHSFRAHKADVLAIAVGTDGTNVFTSGIDQKTSEFKLTKVNSSKAGMETLRWTQASGRRLHSHDVRGMIVSPPYTLSTPQQSSGNTLQTPKIPILTSGGLDVSLVIVAASPLALVSKSPKNPVSSSASTEFESSVHRKASFVPQRGSKCLAVASEAKLIICRRERSVGLWRLNTTPSHVGRKLGGKGIWIVKNHDLPSYSEGDLAEDVEDSNPVEESGWEKLVEMELKTQTNLISSAISNNGRWLAVSDLYETKLFRLVSRNGNVTPRRQKSFSTALHESLPTTMGTGSSSLLFSKDSKYLVLASCFGSIIAIISLPDLKSDVFEFKKLFRQHGTRGSGSREVKGQQRIVSSAIKLGNGFVNGHTPRQINGVNGNGKSHSSASSEDEEESEASSDEDDMDEDDKDGKADMTLLENVADRPASITCMAISEDGQWLASADIEKKVCVFDLHTFELHTTLPTLNHAPCSLAFLPYSGSSTSPTEPNLLLALPNNALSLFGLHSLRFHASALPLSSPKSNTLMNNREPALGIVIESSRGDNRNRNLITDSKVALVWGANWIAKIDFEAIADASHVSKTNKRARNTAVAVITGERRKPRKTSREDNVEKSVASNEILSTELNIKVVRKFQPLVLFDSVGDGELVVVERTWLDIAGQLPEAWVRSGEYGS